MNREKKWQKIRRLEEIILSAPPPKAAKITKRLARLKAGLFKR